MEHEMLLRAFAKFTKSIMKKQYHQDGQNSIKGDVHQSVKDALKRYFSMPSPGYAFLLEGGWGVGKSYFWRQFKETDLKDQKFADITLSVAGLSTREDLATALIVASIDWVPKGMRESASAMRGLLKFIPYTKGFNFAGMGTNSAIQKFAVFVNKKIKARGNRRLDLTVVCLDDVERFSGDFKILFGFINGLLDEDDFHVVMICDEERAVKDLQSYRTYRERVVGQTISMSSDASTIYDLIVKEYANSDVQSAMQEKKVEALTLFQDKKIKNLRTIRFILRELYVLLNAMTWHNKEPVIDTLLSAVTFYAVVTSKEAISARRIMSDIFLKEPMDRYSTLKKNQKEEGGNPEGGADANDWVSSIQDSNFKMDSSDWPCSQAFIGYISGGELNADDIAKDFGIFSGNRIPTAPMPTLLENYRTMDEDSFATAVESLIEQVANHQVMSLDWIWSAWQTLRELREKRLITRGLDECRDIFLNAINTYDDCENLSLSIFLLPQSGAAADDNTILRALHALHDKVEVAKQEKEDLRRQRAIIEGEGEGESHLFHTRVPFSKASAKDVYTRLNQAGRNAVVRMAEFYRRVVLQLPNSNWNNNEIDVKFAKELAALIREQLPSTGKLTLDQGAWNELTNELDKFAQHEK